MKSKAYLLEVRFVMTALGACRWEMSQIPQIQTEMNRSLLDMPASRAALAQLASSPITSSTFFLVRDSLVATLEVMGNMYGHV